MRERAHSLVYMYMCMYAHECEHMCMHERGRAWESEGYICVGWRGLDSCECMVLCVRGSLIMFCNLVFQQHYNPSVYSSFSKKSPSVCIHLIILSNQLSMTPDHVDWGMSKMTSSMDAQASSAFLKCFPFSCLLTEWNKNQSQGAKSGEYDGWVTIRTSLTARKSRVTAAVYALALS